MTAAAQLTARQRVLARALPPRGRRTPGVTFGVLADICVVGLLGLSMWLIVRSGEQPPILHLTFAIVGVRALAIGRAAFRYTERMFSHNAALGQLAELRAETFDALVPRVPGAIESQRRGEVLAAFVDDVDQLQDEPLRVRQPVIVSAIVVVLSILVVALLSPIAALVLTLMLGASGAAAVALARRMAGADDRALSAARAHLVDTILERISAAEVLAAFGAIEVQRDRIAAAQQRLGAIQLARARSAGLSGALLAAAAGVTTLLVLSWLAPSVGSGISGPVLAAVVVVPAAVFEVFMQIPAAFVAKRAVDASADRVAALTETPVPVEIPVDHALGEVTLAEAAVPSAPLLELTGLSVKHPGQSHAAVSEVTCAVHSGETLVITGASGAGKSTIALALVRFLDYRGSYRLRGVEANRLAIREVRGTVGLCEQTPHLFDADLRQNLKFARDTADDTELMAALDRVGLGDWARERGGLDAPVGERGALVSGGQAQRIALARAILADFPVVVLDEPTAGVDRELADQLLGDLLGAVPADRAVILITHTELPSGIPAARLELPAPLHSAHTSGPH